jgi:beta-glucosidase
VSPARARRGESIAVSVEVTNRGQRAGTEIVQVYVGDLYSSLSTPPQRLRRFARVPLETGETRRLDFSLGDDDLTFVGRDGAPVLEPGEFVVRVGGSSRGDDLLEARFWIEDPE